MNFTKNIGMLLLAILLILWGLDQLAGTQFSGDADHHGHSGDRGGSVHPDRALAKVSDEQRREARVESADVASLGGGTLGLHRVGDKLRDACAGLTINPIFDSSITSDPNAATIEATINQAISLYTSYITDPITVSINFAEGGGLGSNSTYYESVTYSTFRNALAADAKTNNDTTVMSLLPSSTRDPVVNSRNINVKTANLRAVGLSGSPPTGEPDGYVTLNTDLTFPGSPGSSLQYSLLAVIQHETDELLGLGSALPNSTTRIFPEDLFRYQSTGSRSFTTTSSQKAYFSLDSTTDIAQFDNQNDGGDFGDWQSNPLPSGVSPKVQDAFATPHATPSLGVELIALDAIGYDVANVWIGAGSNGNWSTSLNWAAAPSNGSNLIFAGTTRLSNRNETLTSVGSMTFDSTAGAFTILGNALSISGGITNNSDQSANDQPEPHAQRRAAVQRGQRRSDDQRHNCHRWQSADDHRLIQHDLGRRHLRNRRDW